VNGKSSSAATHAAQWGARASQLYITPFVGHTCIVFNYDFQLRSSSGSGCYSTDLVPRHTRVQTHLWLPTKECKPTSSSPQESANPPPAPHKRVQTHLRLERRLHTGAGACLIHQVKRLVGQVPAAAKGGASSLASILQQGPSALSGRHLQQQRVAQAYWQTSCNRAQAPCRAGTCSNRAWRKLIGKHPATRVKRLVGQAPAATERGASSFAKHPATRPSALTGRCLHQWVFTHCQCPLKHPHTPSVASPVCDVPVAEDGRGSECAVGDAHLHAKDFG